MSDPLVGTLRYRPAGDPPGGWLEVALGPPGTRAPTPAAGARTVELRCQGLAPGQAVTLCLGAQEHERRADPDGRLLHRDDTVLVATAGAVCFSVQVPDQPPLELILDVRPTRLAEQSLATLLDELEHLCVGLTADLGGHASATLTRAPPAEAALQALERAVGPLEEAVAQVRARPIVRHREQIAAVATSQEPRAVRDLRWLATHPHQSVQARARGPQVGVRRRVHQDLDVPENQGVAALLHRLQRLATSLQRLVHQEQRRLLADRPRREAFQTHDSNLFEQRDLPRLRRLEQRGWRLERILGQVAGARDRLALPATIRPAPFLRSPQVETHPGYFRLHQLWQQVRHLDELRPGPALAPLRNTDELYELWCVLTLSSVLADLARRPLHQLIGPTLAGWFTELPRGRLFTVSLNGWELHLHYEPELRWRPPEGAALGKLHPGRPWRPDLLLEVRAAGQLIEVHLFDAKHSLDPAHPHGVPTHLLDEVWRKYPESIGDPATLLPRVGSCWILYPGATPHIDLIGPAMLDPRWPAERVRGGAIALTPGKSDTHADLRRVLEILLRR